MTILADITFDNFDPPWLWVGITLLAIGALAWTYVGMYRRSGRPIALTLLLLRSMGVIAIMIAIIKPGWTRIEEHIEKPILAVVLDDSQSMWLTAPGTKNTSRYELARRLITASDFSTNLRDRFDISFFNIKGEPLPPEQLPSEAAAEQTDLLLAARAAAARLRGRNASGILLISDGRDTSGRDTLLAAQDISSPVFTVGFSSLPPSSSVPFDLAIASVDAPQRAMVHNAVRVRVVVSKDGGAAADAPINITLTDRVVVAGLISLPEGNAQQATELSFTPETPGDFTFTARIPEQPGERTGRNNAVPFRLRVEAEPIRVLYIEGYLRPEYTFLREHLSSDPDVDLVTLARSAAPDAIGNALGLPGAELLTLDRLRKIDVILLGDFEASMLDESAYAVLNQWLSEGGAMMILGGYHNLTPTGLAATPLGAALPAEPATGATTQIDEPFQFQLTPEGRMHPALFLTGDTTRDVSAWESLPRLSGVVAIGKTKAGSTVLARHPQISADDPQKQGYPVLLTQPYGKGTVTLLTADTTWRWSRLPRLAGQPDTMYSRFWSQMVRWLARRDVVAQRPSFRVTTDALSYERGKRVSIAIRRFPANMVPDAETQTSTPTLLIRTPDGRSVPIPLSASSSDNNTWSATYFPDRGGRFTAEAKLASVPQGGSTPARDIASDITEFLVQGSPLELDDPSTNPAGLAQIASLTGGVSATIDDDASLQYLLDALPDSASTSYETRRAGMWNSPLLFVLFLALICVEWVIRRRNQLI